MQAFYRIFTALFLITNLKECESRGRQLINKFEQEELYLIDQSSNTTNLESDV